MVSEKSFQGSVLLPSPLSANKRKSCMTPVPHPRPEEAAVGPVEEMDAIAPSTLALLGAIK